MYSYIGSLLQETRRDFELRTRASCSVPSAKAWCCFPWPTTPEFRKDHWGIKQQLMNVYI